MTTDNHDPFALGGDQRDNGDARVRALFREWLEEYQTTDRLVDDQPECDAALDALIDHIEDTAPHTMIGVAVKLRRLCDEDVGMAAGQNEGELASLGQVLEFIEREVAR